MWGPAEAPTPRVREPKRPPAAYPDGQGQDDPSESGDCGVQIPSRVMLCCSRMNSVWLPVMDCGPTRADSVMSPPPIRPIRAIRGRKYR